VIVIINIILSSQKATPGKEARIINGERASNTPFHVHVTYLDNLSFGFFGGGVLISDQHVLTVASNIHGFVQWRLGFGSITHVALESRVSTNAIQHPAYNPVTRLNDVGIIVLPAQILLTGKVGKFLQNFTEFVHEFFKFTKCFYLFRTTRFIESETIKCITTKVVF
jgi:secreted trypsin-like serine protease